ncbi:sulfotransferase [Streptomyces sp. RLB1-33]|nr:sulfotransferase [Streptomyces sp. RLB1-33]
MATWAQVVDATRKYACELGPDSWYQLRFEDLVADPESQLQGVCGFLGEEYAPGMTEPRRVAGMAVPARRPGTDAPTACWTPPGTAPGPPD